MKKTALLESAAQTLKNAYAPYSQYNVSAALLCLDGSVVNGCNVENASFGLTNCAERTALFSAIATAHRHFTAIAIVSDGNRLPLPCGACLQVMAEFCEPDFAIYCAQTNDLEHAKAFTLKELLPHAFNLIEV